MSSVDSQVLQGKTIAISAGGTGGHVYPALCVARALQEQAAKVIWLGTERGLENRLVPELGIPLHSIPMLGVRGNGLKRLFSAPIMLFKAYRAAKQVFTQQPIDLFIGFGGYVSLPSGLAAKMMGVPVLLHEQNARMGLSNRLLCHLARRVLLAFPIDAYQGGRFSVIGNPVRYEISQASDYVEKTAQQTINLLIIGGSQGAKIINETVVPMLSILAANCRRPIQVIHQTGERTFATTQSAYQVAGQCAEQVSAENQPAENQPAENQSAESQQTENRQAAIYQQAQVVAYIEDMASAYQQADIIIARAGALSVSEIASAGRAAVFIPLACAVDNHQVYNAQFLVKAGAAQMLEESALNPQALGKIVGELIHDNRLLTMAQKARQQSHQCALTQCIQHSKEILAKP